MRDIAIRLPRDIDCSVVERAIDDAVIHCGLNISLRDTLKKYPGCIHWHAKNGRESGTLEVTLWPKEHRAWFTIQDGRKAAWIEAKMKEVHKATIERLAGD